MPDRRKGNDRRVTDLENRVNIVNFVLDQSGSMQSCLSETISGFNEWLLNLQNDNKATHEMSLTKFNSGDIDVSPVKNVKDVRELTTSTFLPAHLTPLYDAVGDAIKETERHVRNNQNSQVTIVILTDGYENASREWSQENVKKLIERKQREDWTFLFLGAGEDAWQAGFNLGVPKGNTAIFNVDNMHNTIRTVSDTYSAHTHNTAHAVASSSSSYFADTKEVDQSALKTEASDKQA